MSTTRDGSMLVFECDTKGCGETASDDDNDFTAMWEYLKEQGWKTYKQNGQWKHCCPDCQDNSLASLTKGLP